MGGTRDAIVEKELAGYPGPGTDVPAQYRGDEPGSDVEYGVTGIFRAGTDWACGAARTYGTELLDGGNTRVTKWDPDRAARYQSPA
eukprot:3063654-Rhodomonas_salina.1